MSVCYTKDSARIVDRWVEMSAAKLCNNCFEREPEKSGTKDALRNAKNAFSREALFWTMRSGLSSKFKQMEKKLNHHNLCSHDKRCNLIQFYADFIGCCYRCG